jgi:hypothetical protein
LNELSNEFFAMFHYIGSFMAQKVQSTTVSHKFGPRTTQIESATCNRPN